jgi:hypothetical protein
MTVTHPDRVEHRLPPLSQYPVHPLLFAAYAVLFLYSSNLAGVLLVDAGDPLAVAVVQAIVFYAAAAILFRSARRGAVVASAILVAWYGFGRAAPLLAGAGLDEPKQMGVWLLFIVAAAAYAVFARRSLPTATALLNIVSAVLVALTLVSIIPYEAARGVRPVVALQAGLTGSGGPRPTRDVYYLVFDRYGSADAIKTAFGITDDDLYGWLETRGFQVVKDSHANYRATDFSLAATLNMTYLDDLTKTVGRVSGDRTPAQAMLQGNRVGKEFQALGYRYVHLGSWFGPTSSDPTADENITSGVTSEFESVLRDTTVLPALERLRGDEQAARTFFERHGDLALFQFRQLTRLASAPGPKFVFAHILLPHDPYVFRADGTRYTEEESAGMDEAGLYAGQMAYLNGRIKELVETLTAGDDAADPIIILQADEGPLACRGVDCPKDDPRYFEIRFGNLNAMFLPGVDAVVPRGITSVNTFRFLFGAVFGEDIDLLPNRSFTWPDNDHIYDFRDITDEIPP